MLLPVLLAGSAAAWLLTAEDVEPPPPPAVTVAPPPAETAPPAAPVVKAEEPQPAPVAEEEPPPPAVEEEPPAPPPETVQAPAPQVPTAEVPAPPLPEPKPAEPPPEEADVAEPVPPSKPSAFILVMGEDGTGPSPRATSSSIPAIPAKALPHGFWNAVAAPPSTRRVRPPTSGTSAVRCRGRSARRETYQLAGGGAAGEFPAPMTCWSKSMMAPVMRPDSSLDR